MRSRFLGDSGPGRGVTHSVLRVHQRGLLRFFAVLARARAAKEVLAVVLVELGVVEQRHRAVLEVLDGASVTDVARLYGVHRPALSKSSNSNMCGWRGFLSWLNGFTNWSNKIQIDRNIGRSAGAREHVPY